MSLYEKIQELKNQIATGAISGYTALDLFMQHVESQVPEPQPPVDNDHVAEGSQLFFAADPVPEPASAEPADGLTAAADSE